MTGTQWIGESGFLETPILITNTRVVLKTSNGWAPLIFFVTLIVTPSG